MMSISIIIPTYNRAACLSETLATLARLQKPAGLDGEILVIDNGGADATAAVVAEHADTCVFPVRSVVEPAQGLCRARNRGLLDARYDHLVYLDDDVNVAGGWLTAYREAVEDHGADCVVGPVTPVFEIEPPDYMSARVLDSLASSYSLHGPSVTRLSAEVAHLVPGCNFAVRKEVAAKVGGFDVRFDRSARSLLAGGDTEFGLRLARAQCVVVYHPECAVQHRIGAAKFDRSYLRRRWHGLGITQRMLARTEHRTPSLKARCGGCLGAVRMFGKAACLGLAGRRAPALEYHLRALRAAGYWWGPSARLLAEPDERGRT